VTSPFSVRESELVHDEVLGRTIRTGPVREQAVSNVARIRAAIDEGRTADALALIDFLAESASWNYRQQRDWIAETRRFLSNRGVGTGEMALLDSDLATLVGGATPFDCDRLWKAFQMRRARLVRELEAPKSTALQSLHRLVEAWRGLYDGCIDMLAGYMDAIVRRFGEDALEELYRQRLVEPVFVEKYAKYDVAKNDWQEMFPYLVYISMDGRRAHLSGPGRLGEVDIEEFEDRVEIRIDPCSSGGRLVRGEPLDGTGPRMEQPYGFRPLERAHDWAWQRKGVCAYCAHCCLLHTKIPIERFGYPLRVLDPPTYPDRKDAKCVWTMYRRIEDIPESAYREVGEEKLRRRG